MLLSADFETTTSPEDCRVWAWAYCDITNIGHFRYGNNMHSFFTMLFKDGNNHTLYFHNLKFDGEFILHYLLSNNYTHIKNKEDKADKTFSTLISDTGVFYSIEIYEKVDKKKGKTLKILNSMNIIPFGVKEIGISFGLPVQKGELDYHKYRPINHEITPEELVYIQGDVTIVALALNTLFEQGLTHMTQGSNALHYYKNLIGLRNFERWYPTPDYDEEIRQSYKGGFTYANPRILEKDIKDGIVLDVNSLYPSVMAFEKLPYGEPIWFDGEYEQNDLFPLYIVSFECMFDLKENYIPTIQLKHSLRWNPTEFLTSSNGEITSLCMTSIDLALFLDHYDVDCLTYHGGYMFKASNILFKDYVEYWTEQKTKAKKENNDGLYVLAKLMLNSLYGKFATNPNVQGKIPYLDNDIVKYHLAEKETRKPVYLPVGTFITAYARNKTIRSAQTCFDRFLYADTDSLHLTGTEIPKELEIDDYKLGAWKWEFQFEKARFLRAKSYIEYGHKIKNGKQDGENFLKVVCAGLPDNCKESVTWDNFRTGKVFKGKLQMSHVKGGIVLKEVDFSIKRK